jgi:hypothetical protein
MDEFFHNFSLPPLPVEGPQNLSTILLQFFHNSSSILPLGEEFGASGLAWRRIVEEIIVEKSWKHLVNALYFQAMYVNHVSKSFPVQRRGL